MSAPWKEGKDPYISYSGMQTYLLCPRKYFLGYVEKPPGIVRDPRDSLFGSIIGKVFEWFYSRGAWAQEDPVAATLSMVEPAAQAVFDEESVNPSFDRLFFDHMKGEIRSLVPKGIEVIRANGLLTERSEAELKLNVTATKDGKSLRLGGRADFVHWSSDGVWILDGKSSVHRELYADPQQLVWYALLFYLRFKVAPTRLGFIFWRFPENAVQWVDYDADSMRRVHSLAFEVSGKIGLKMFDATPSKGCVLCEYKPVCPEGARHANDLRVESRGRVESSIFDLEFV
jgi:CRISPR/Cas system-associated exonuclease Cas4 (RecB family)